MKSLCMPLRSSLDLIDMTGSFFCNRRLVKQAFSYIFCLTTFFFRNTGLKLLAILYARRDDWTRGKMEIKRHTRMT